MISADTPVYQQYKDLKKQVPDAILFFRLGDFYEMFWEDAKWAAAILELSLTSRNQNAADPIPMAGVPFHAVEGYIQRLVEVGKKVAIAEQVGVIGTGAKKLIDRKIVRVITPGLSGDTTAAAHESAWLVSITQNRRGAAVGLLDASTGDLRVCQVEGLEAAVAEAGRHGPREALLTEESDTPAVRQALGGICVTVVKDRSVDIEALRQQVGVWSLDGLTSGLEAVQILLRYARENLRSDLSNVVSLHQYKLGNSLLMDESTRRNLELFRNLRGQGRAGTVLSLLDMAQTPMGGRLVREWLGAPLLDVEKIRERQGAVGRFVADTGARRALRAALAQVSDLERLAARVSQGTATPRNVNALRASLDQLPAVVEALSGEELRALLPDDLAADVADDIRAWLVPEPPISPTEGGLVPEGADPDLDRMRMRARDGKGEIARLETKLKNVSGIQSLKIKHITNMGYLIEVSLANKDRVPKDWILKQNLSNNYRYFTQELKEFEETILTADERSMAQEYKHFTALRLRVGEQVARIQVLARSVATLDALSTLAEVAVRHRFCCPSVDNSGELDIRAGRHPVVESLLADTPFVANDLKMDARAQFIVLTGPNMAGKSTLMRQVALIALLAQIGSFVPAAAARIGICDRICVRVGASDDLAHGQSTFMVEMSETASILQSATASSLVLLDEIGRGTSTYDGLSIAWAVAEDLHDRVRCRAIFATHYHELAALRETCARLRNMHVAISEQNDRLTFLRKLREGAASSSYGIQCARLAGLPLAVVRRAKTVLKEMELRRPRPEPTQLSLFGVAGAEIAPEAGTERAPEPRTEIAPEPPSPPPPDPVRLALAEIDPDQLSPREAHQALYRLRGMLEAAG